MLPAGTPDRQEGRPAWNDPRGPEELDLDRPNAARMYDYFLGGSHNFAVDREVAVQAIQAWPDMPGSCRPTEHSSAGRSVTSSTRASGSSWRSAPESRRSATF